MGVYIWTDNWIPNANTIAYYPLTAETTANDKSGNGYNLTNANVTFGTNGGVSCASFNGTNSMLYGGSSYTTGTPATISIWVYHISRNGTEDPIYYGGFGVYITSDRKINNGSTYLPSGVWTHLVLTINSSGNYTVYMNGVSVFTNTYTLASGQTYIGTYNGTKDRWKGYISEAIIENRVWTSDQITGYFNQTKSLYGIS